MRLINVIIFILSATYAKKQCVPRDYGEGSIVCVCNATYCDVAEQFNIADLNGSTVHHYVSNKDGLRMDYKAREFAQEKSDIVNSYLIKVQKNVTYQTILGYGGAITDATGINTASLSENAKSLLLRQYFSDEGSKYSLIRVPIGGTDFSTHYYEYENNTADPTLSNFNLSSEDYDYKIPFIKHVQEISNRSIKIFASAWSAPEWMKIYLDNNTHSRLHPNYYQLWADYHVKFLDMYEKEGINFWGLTTQNEPSHGRDIDIQFNSMGWTADEQREWLVGNLGPTLAEHQYSDLKVMILDDQRTYVKNWSEVLYGNKSAYSYSSGMAVHWYSDLTEPASLLAEVHDNYPEKFILYTEACNQIFPPNLPLGSWTDAQKYISNIIEVTYNWVSGWVDWNLVLNLDGGPLWSGTGANAAIIVNATADEFYKQPMYYAISHISKFVPQESVRIALETDVDVHVETVAFVTPDDIIVLLIHNKGPEEVPVVISDEDKGQVNIDISSNSINTLLYKI